MAPEQQSSPENVRLHAFTDLDRAPSIEPYVAALEAFDALPQLQELKSLARERAGIGPGSTVLDVGCGFGLESLRLARLVQPGGRVAGIDKMRDLAIDTRIVIFTPDLAAAYFTETGRTAQSAGVIDAGEFDHWAAAIEDLRQRSRLFCSIGYYLFTAQV